MNLPAPAVRWPLGIAAILGATVAVNLAVLRVANNDPSFAVEPDYYRRAVAWDSTMAHARASAALGWRAAVAVSPLDGDTPATLTLTLTDAGGAPVTKATVAVEALYNARAGHPVAATLREVAPGRYLATLPMPWTGQWEVRCTATRAAQGGAPPARFEATLRTTVVRDGAAPVSAGG